METQHTTRRPYTAVGIWKDTGQNIIERVLGYCPNSAAAGARVQAARRRSPGDDAVYDFTPDDAHIITLFDGHLFPYLNPDL